jgi:hypothetical protein
MKKLILSVALLAGITFIACSDEDNVFPTVAFSGCQTCEIASDSLSNLPNENYDICVGAGDTLVYVDGANTGIRPDRYFQLFCDNAYGEVTDTTIVIPGAPDPTCVTCIAYLDTINNDTVPAYEVCKAPDGKAVVNGTALTLDYDTFIAAQREITTCN